MIVLRRQFPEPQRQTRHRRGRRRLGPYGKATAEDQQTDAGDTAFHGGKHNAIRRHRESGIMSHMPLQFRLAQPPDHPRIEEMVIDSFEPITWFKKLDARIGPLNGRDWHTRWQGRMRQVFETETVLIGESEGAIAAMSAGNLDRENALAYVDL